MLSLVIFLPLLAAAALLLPGVGRRVAGAVWIAATAADLVLAVVLWATHPAGSGIGHETLLRWIPTLGAGYHVGVDGLSLPLIAMTCVLFLACAVYSWRTPPSRAYAALFLGLQTVSLGVFAALDLLLFFVFFDLSIVGMYFVIAGWGHGDRARSALKFFLYTFLGSLALLLGFIGLFAGSGTFDMVDLARTPPFAGEPGAAAATLLAVVVGLAVKTPAVPLHTWLPPAHTDAPSAGSAILAGVLLKMGTYGFARIAMPMLPQAWQRHAWVIVIIGVAGVLYGALVALAQDDVKRLIAYTSVNHMGYILLALGVAGLTAAPAGARTLAVSGAITQMVSHGLLTGALFLVAGVLWDRVRSYDQRRLGGIAATAPRLTAMTAVAAFGSLGLPGLSGFMAEFQIFAGVIGTGVPGAVAAGVLSVGGILITAALFLRMLRQAFLGPPGELTVSPDARRPETAAIVPLLALSVLIGLAPHWLLELAAPASAAIVSLVSRP
ncbi:NADH-quinone oxidoreductase subunit M [Spongiactinospora sp. TRM90649]|uniref:complex I subunit 4 family protein n=1 Tax=Spongiactinospora sp. TRM90649 TaxID=3031114 RepID=UPI0023F7FBD9|nr:NADH-quinone oxidoreductase subunit M [Spongiactinospora sp. TRM90649]MDF5752197.1 NADH-quinone oxidoreductase subunit M [Spongiactinospora sp. TRM90649]